MAERWPDLGGRLVAGGHVLAVRVYYEDTDFSGAVYHANYLKFCERGRSDYLRLIGIHHHELKASIEGLAFVVSRMECEFRRPARIDDVVEIETRFRARSGARLMLDQEIERQGESLFKASVTVAVVDKRGRPRRLPATILGAVPPAQPRLPGSSG
jgi:acyl-CoA thioester hydrolase